MASVCLSSYRHGPNRGLSNSEVMRHYGERTPFSAWYGLSVASPPACPPATADAMRSAVPAKTSVHNIVTAVFTEVSVVPALVITLTVPVVERTADRFASIVSITIDTRHASTSLRCRKADNAESDDKDRGKKPSHLVILTEGHTTIDYYKL